jgi:ribosome-associated protein
MIPDEKQSLELVRLCCRALAEKKAADLRVLDVRALSTITDYLVIGTATSEPHIRALRVELEKALDANKTHIVGFETTPESGWVVFDAFDVMVHIFTAEKRDGYRLEKLWRDGKEIEVAELLADKKRRARKSPKTAGTRPGVRKSGKRPK